MIDPAKDLDGISPVNIAKGVQRRYERFCAVYGGGSGMHAENERYRAFWQTGGSRRKKHGCGRPLSMLLLHENATVTICHSRTASLPEVCREADILTACVGKAAMINHTYEKRMRLSLTLGSM